MELVYSVFSLLLSAWYDLRTAKYRYGFNCLVWNNRSAGLLTGAWQEYSGVLAAFAWDISALVTICTGGAVRATAVFIVSACYLALTNYRAFLCGLFLRTQSGDGSMGIYSWY